MRGASEISFTYSKARLPQSQAQSIAHTFVHTVRTIVANGDTRLRNLDFCSSFDKKKIFDWNNNPPAPVEKCVNELLESQMRANPSSAAIVTSSMCMSYRELDLRSASVASRLVALGTRPECFVPFCFEHGAYAIVSIVGIIRAGAACVPFDPSHPLHRMEQVASQIRPTVILCSETNRDRCSRLAEHTLVVDANLQSAEQHFGAPKAEVLPLHAVYAMFTSGSTVC